MFEKQLQYFIDNQDELVRQYDGKVLVLVGEKVADVYPTMLEAYLESKEKYAPGTYMLQECTPGESAYTVTISHWL